MGNNSSIRIIIADDHRLIRQGVISLIDNKSGITVIDEVDNGEQLIKSYFDLFPDIILVDIQMPVMGGFEALQKIKSQDKNVKSLFLSMFNDEHYFLNVVKEGGNGLIGKDAIAGQLIDAINVVNNGFYYYKKAMTENELNKFYENHNSNYVKKAGTIDFDLTKAAILTDREKEVLSSFAEGLTRSEVCDQLFISINTLDFHKRNIMEKLKLNTFPKLLKFAFEYIQRTNQNKA